MSSVKPQKVSMPTPQPIASPPLISGEARVTITGVFIGVIIYIMKYKKYSLQLQKP